MRRIKKKTQLGDQKLIQYQILQIEIISILCQTVERITNPPLTLLNSAGELLHPCSLRGLSFSAKPCLALEYCDYPGREFNQSQSALPLSLPLSLPLMGLAGTH